MKPTRLALLALALAAAPLWATPPKKAVPLVVSGDTVVVVKTLPCKVTAPAGADLYFWSLPPGVAGTAEDGVLTVTAAPAGDSTIGVTSVTITITVDKATGAVTKTVAKDKGTVVLTNGLTPPPPPPPVPPAPLTASLQAAYAAETSPTKAADVKLLAALYRGAMAAAAADPAVKTYGDLLTKMHNAKVAMIAGKVMGANLPLVVAAAGADVNATFGTDASAPIDAAKATAEFTKLAAILEGVK